MAAFSRQELQIRTATNHYVNEWQHKLMAHICTTMLEWVRRNKENNVALHYQHSVRRTRASSNGQPAMQKGITSWWRHQMEIFSAVLALCAGNSPVTGEFPSQRPVTRSFDVFFDLRLNKRLSKQSWGWWFETPSCSLWRHRNDKFLYHVSIAHASLRARELKAWLWLDDLIYSPISITSNWKTCGYSYRISPRNNKKYFYIDY